MAQRSKTGYHFTVDWGGARNEFLEVSGLNISVDVAELREGGDPNQAAHKVPGHVHYGNIVLKRGIIKDDDDFFAWMNSNLINQVERRDIIVNLLDKKDKPIISWKAVRAFPVRFTVPVLIARATDVAIEELELAHEGLIVETT